VDYQPFLILIFILGQKLELFQLNKFFFEENNLEDELEEPEEPEEPEEDEDLQPSKPSKIKSQDMDKVERTSSDNGTFVNLIEHALRELGGRGTGQEVADWIGKRHADLAANKKKLAYTVNAILSAKKYRTLFTKDVGMKSERTIWKLSNMRGK